MSSLDEVAARLEVLRGSGDHKAWAKLRRVMIVAPCCKSEPLIEVMATDPPVLLVAQPDYGGARTDDPQRKPFAGVHRGGTGVERLAAVEQAAERGGHQSKIVWCRHQRWNVPLDAIVTGQGQYVLTGADRPRRGVT